MPPTAFTHEELVAARELLVRLTRQLADWPTHDPAFHDVLKLSARLTQLAKKQTRRTETRRDIDIRDSSGLRTGEAVTALPAFSRDHTCYICQQPFARPHRFYDAMCEPCGNVNFAKREQSADLSGRVALVTGGRIRSGYHVARKLLRAGAEVIVTTRFPNDGRRRFEEEPDVAEWRDRLHLVGLDLRHLPKVEAFCRSAGERFPKLDIFIANAAQTVRRPPAYYAALVEGELPRLPKSGFDFGSPAEPETTPTQLLQPPRLPKSKSDFGSLEAPWYASLSLVPLLPEDTETRLFPFGQTAADGEPLDLRDENSWALPQERVSTVELVETQAVNVMAPFLMLRELRPLFRKANRDTYAVMVSAAEGRFSSAKTGTHPHTNMAKAALNMLVRTSSEEFAADRIALSAVDPGWFSVQSAAPSAERMHESGGRVPLDAEDAAARILDPVFAELRQHGVLFKDYAVAGW